MGKTHELIMRDMQDENNKLRAELDYWKRDSAAAWDRCEFRGAERDALRAKRDALRAQLDEVCAVLEPFAAAEVYCGSQNTDPDDEVVKWLFAIGHIRRARAVYEKIKGGGDE